MTAGQGQAIDTLPDVIARIELRGRCWCYVDFRGGSGFNLPAGDAAFVYMPVQGDVRLAVGGGAPVTLAPGDIGFMLSGEAHAVRSEAGCIVRPIAFLRDGAEADVPPTLCIGEHGAVGVRLLAGRLTAEWPRGLRRTRVPPLIVLAADRVAAAAPFLGVDALRQAGVGAGASAMLTRLAALLLAAAGRVNGPHPDPRDDDPIARALALIEETPAADWTVETLARAVGMGRSNFAARFTALEGRAPMEVVIDARMRLALDLLRDTDAKIAAIAARVGYGSEGAFSRRFARHFGLSPSLARQRAVKPAPAIAGGAWRRLLTPPGGDTGARPAPRPSLRAVTSLTRFTSR